MPILQRELRCLKVRADALEEQCKAATEASDSLLTEVARLSDRVAELEGQVEAPS